MITKATFYTYATKQRKLEVYRKYLKYKPSHALLRFQVPRSTDQILDLGHIGEASISSE